MKLRNRTILITGGTSGIGRELAMQLLERENTVIVTGRDQATLDATQRALPGLHIVKSDVGDAGAIATLKDNVLAKFPALDTLINNAGIMRNLDISRPRDLQDVVREIDINFSGPVRMIQEFLPHLKAKNGTLIVNVSSGLAFVPLPISPVYSATKAAIHSFTQSLRVQLAGTGVTVVELAPPLVDTALGGGEFKDAMKGQTGMNVKVLVHKAITGIEAGRLEIRPGLSNVLMIMSRLAPRFMLKQVSKMANTSALPVTAAKTR